MVQGVVHAIVQHVEGEASGDDPIGHRGREDDVCESCEWGFQGQEEGGRHD